MVSAERYYAPVLPKVDNGGTDDEIAEALDIGHVTVERFVNHSLKAHPESSLPSKSLKLYDADIRLLLPGRCMLCLGGVRQEAEARQVLASADAEHSIYTQRNWQSERTGSLASLNQGASAIALRTLEDLIAERIDASAWTQIEFDAAGRLQVLHPTETEVRRACAVSLGRRWIATNRLTAARGTIAVRLKQFKLYRDLKPA